MKKREVKKKAEAVGKGSGGVGGGGGANESEKSLQTKRKIVKAKSDVGKAPDGSNKEETTVDKEEKKPSPKQGNPISLDVLTPEKIKKLISSAGMDENFVNIVESMKCYYLNDRLVNQQMPEINPKEAEINNISNNSERKESGSGPTAIPEISQRSSAKDDGSACALSSFDFYIPENTTSDCRTSVSSEPSSLPSNFSIKSTEKSSAKSFEQAHPFIACLTEMINEQRQAADKSKQVDVSMIRLDVERNNVGSANKDHKAMSIEEEMNSLRRMQDTFREALETDSFEGINSNALRRTSSLDNSTLGLGIQLLCSLVDDENLEKKEKHKLVREIIKRIIFLSNEKLDILVEAETPPSSKIREKNQSVQFSKKHLQINEAGESPRLSLQKSKESEMKVAKKSKGAGRTKESPRGHQQTKKPIIVTDNSDYTMLSPRQKRIEAKKSKASCNKVKVFKETRQNPDSFSLSDIRSHNMRDSQSSSSDFSTSGRTMCSKQPIIIEIKSKTCTCIPENLTQTNTQRSTNNTETTSDLVSTMTPSSGKMFTCKYCLKSQNSKSDKSKTNSEQSHSSKHLASKKKSQTAQSGSSGSSCKSKKSWKSSNVCETIYEDLDPSDYQPPQENKAAAAIQSKKGSTKDQLSETEEKLCEIHGTRSKLHSMVDMPAKSLNMKNNYLNIYTMDTNINMSYPKVQKTAVVTQSKLSDEESIHIYDEVPDEVPDEVWEEKKAKPASTKTATTISKADNAADYSFKLPPFKLVSSVKSSKQYKPQDKYRQVISDFESTNSSSSTKASSPRSSSSSSVSSLLFAEDKEKPPPVSRSKAYIQEWLDPLTQSEIEYEKNKKKRKTVVIQESEKLPPKRPPPFSEDSHIYDELKISTSGDDNTRKFNLEQIKIILEDGDTDNSGPDDDEPIYEIPSIHAHFKRKNHRNTGGGASQMNRRPRDKAKTIEEIPPPAPPRKQSLQSKSSSPSSSEKEDNKGGEVVQSGRSKLDTPFNSAASESVESFVNQRYFEFLEQYTANKKAFQEELQIQRRQQEAMLLLQKEKLIERELQSLKSQHLAAAHNCPHTLPFAACHNHLPACYVPCHICAPRGCQCSTAAPQPTRHRNTQTQTQNETETVPSPPPPIPPPISSPSKHREKHSNSETKVHTMTPNNVSSAASLATSSSSLHISSSKSKTSNSRLSSTSEVSVPMGLTNQSSSSTTTTHHYDEVSEGPITAESSRPHYSIRSEHGTKASGMIMKPKGIAYIIQFDKTNPKLRNKTTSSSSSQRSEMPEAPSQNRRMLADEHMRTRMMAKTTTSASGSGSGNRDEFVDRDAAIQQRDEEELTSMYFHTLQEHLTNNKPSFLSRAKKRQDLLNQLQKYRQERQRELVEIIENTSINSLDRKLSNLPPPPRCEKSLFRTKEMRAMSKHKFSKLPEVVAKRQQEREEKRRKSHRLLRDIFNKRLQKHVHKGKLSLNNSQFVV